MKLKQIDRPTCRILRTEIEQALRSVSEKFGVRVETGNGRYDESQFTVKVMVSVEGAPEGGQIGSSLLGMYGIKPEALTDNAEFRHHGSIFSLQGFKPSRPKYPFVGKSRLMRFVTA